MVFFAGLSEEELRELCESLETRFYVGICDEAMCADAVRLCRSIEELLEAYESTRHRLKVCQAQLALIRKGQKPRKT